MEPKSSYTTVFKTAHHYPYANESSPYSICYRSSNCVLQSCYPNTKFYFSFPYQKISIQCFYSGFNNSVWNPSVVLYLVFPVFPNCNCCSRWCPLVGWYPTVDHYVITFVFLLCFRYNGNVNSSFQRSVCNSSVFSAIPLTFQVATFGFPNRCPSNLAVLS